MTMYWPLAKAFPAGTRGAVAAKHPLAAEAGVAILRQGGSAVDAAVATSLAIGVVEPYLSGIGGGGLAIHAPAGGELQALHFGMRAPSSATPDMYRIEPGASTSDLPWWPPTEGDEHMAGPTSVAVPCHVQGLHRLWQSGGRLPWDELVAPAIALARDGFAADWLTSIRILQGQDLISRFAETRTTFLPRGRPPLPETTSGSEMVYQPDLATTHEQIAQDPRAMQHGPVADAIVQATNGRITVEDLQSQQPSSGAPISLAFGNAEVHLAGWATGGPTLLEWLGILRALDPPAEEDNPELWWAVVRAGYAALADRLARLADPDCVPFPEEILDAAYHQRLAAEIQEHRAGMAVPVPGGGSTSHLAVVDEAGSCITVTQTLLSLFGSGVMAPGTGVLLNNGMMWFDPRPGRPNSIAGGKRPLANMCPVLVTRDGHPWLAFGASGGRRILPALVQIVVRTVVLGQSLAEAMAAPRLDNTEGLVEADARFGEAFGERLARRLGEPVRLRPPMLGASPWASPVGLERLKDGSWTGGADMNTMACVMTV